MNIEKTQCTTSGYTLTDARQHPQAYKTLFRQYCGELSESDPTMAQYDPNELAQENLQSRLDHPFLIEAEGAIGLVVFMDEEAPRNADSCHSYLGELFVCKPWRNRGIAGRIAEDFLAAQEYDAGLCFVRGSAAEDFWRDTLTRLGYEFEVFEEDEVRDFLHIHLRHRNGET